MCVWFSCDFEAGFDCSCSINPGNVVMFAGSGRKSGGAGARVAGGSVEEGSGVLEAVLEWIIRRRVAGGVAEGCGRTNEALYLESRTHMTVPNLGDKSNTGSTDQQKRHGRKS